MCKVHAYETRRTRVHDMRINKRGLRLHTSPPALHTPPSACMSAHASRPLSGGGGTGRRVTSFLTQPCPGSSYSYMYSYSRSPSLLDVGDFKRRWTRSQRVHGVGVRSSQRARWTAAGASRELDDICEESRGTSGDTSDDASDGTCDDTSDDTSGASEEGAEGSQTRRSAPSHCVETEAVPSWRCAHPSEMRSHPSDHGATSGASRSERDESKCGTCASASWYASASAKA